MGTDRTPPPCVTEPLEMRPFSTCYPAGFGRSRSNGMSVIKEKMTPRIPPFKVVGTVTDRSAKLSSC